MGTFTRILHSQCPGGYTTKPLSEVAQLQGGYAFKSASYSQQGMRVIRISDVQKGHIARDAATYYPPGSQEPFDKAILREHDLVLTLTGNVGRVAIIDRQLLPAAANQRVLVIRAQPQVDHRFLFHYLNSKEVGTALAGHATGSAQKNVSIRRVKAVEVPVPPLPVQRKIAAAMDELGVLQQEMRACVQEEKQVRTAQLHALQSKLFTTGPDPSRLLTPTYRALGQVATLKRGQPMARKNIHAGAVPVIAGGRRPAYFHNEANRDGSTIVIAGSGANAGYVSWWEGPIFVSDAFTVAPDPEVLEPKYCYHFLSHRQSWLYSQKRGAGVPHVYPSDTALLPVPIIPLAAQREVARILEHYTRINAELLAALDAQLQDCAG